MPLEIIYKDLKLSDKFNVAFPDERIPNGFIDKTKTRLGITYTSFHDKRNSVNVLPSVPIIDQAMTDYSYLDLFAITEGVKTKDIEKYLLSDKPYKRILITPEGFEKIIIAANNINKLQWLYDNFFLYLDECHCYATEAFRKEILTPFKNDYAFKFKDRAMGSATTFPSSDPRIKALQPYKMRYNESFGKITIVNYPSPKDALHYMLTHPHMFPRNVHIFFNTIIECGEAIRATGIKDVNVYCRDNEKNTKSLEDEWAYFKSMPVEGEYKKFNFYSCRYNEGWALKDDETATIILVTDVNIPHSLIGIPYKGFQAVGRSNVTPNKIYHITNNYGKQGMKSFETIQQKWLYNAEEYIKYSNIHINQCKTDQMEDNGLLKKLVEPFSDFKNGKYTLNNNKVDQFICDEYCKEHYNSLETIELTWQSLNYETELASFDLLPIVRIKKSQQEINKQVIERFEELRNHPENYIYEVASATMKKYQFEFQQLFEAYHLLGKDELEKLNYDDKAMKAALIKRATITQRLNYASCL